MRGILVFLVASILTCSVETARADPYRWCAVYGGDSGGSTNCYFLTWEQCQAAIAGPGGFCAPNPFYDGRPVQTPENGDRRRAKLRG